MKVIAEILSWCLAGISMLVLLTLIFGMTYEEIEAIFKALGS